MTIAFRTKPLQDCAEFSITLDPDFDFSAPEYGQLYADSAATAFQAPVWMQHVHGILLPALDATQQTIVVRHRATGTLAAVFPMVMQRPMGLRIVQPADFGVCDCNAVVASQEVLTALLRDSCALSRINAELEIGDLFMFRKIRDDGFDFSLLFPHAHSSPTENAAYTCRHAATYEDWLALRMSHDSRKRLRQKARKLSAAYGRVEVRRLTDPDEIRDSITFIRDIRKVRISGDILGVPHYFRFYQEYAAAGSAAGEASVYAMYIDGEMKAAELGLHAKGTFWAIVPGADLQDKYARSSLGTQLQSEIIRLRHEAGDTLTDLGPGYSSYKSHFGAEEVSLKNATRANSLIGAGLGAVYHHAKPLKNHLRDLAGHIR